MRGIPTLNLRGYRRGTPIERAQFARELRDGLCELGFVALEGHGIDPVLIRSVFRRFETFFSLPEVEKLACAGVAGGQRGFTPFGIEHARDRMHADLKEFFHVGQPCPGESVAEVSDEGEFAREVATYPANVWPKDSRELEADAVCMFRALERCAQELLCALAESFDLPRETFAAMMHGGNSILRALHYPPVSPEAAHGALRAAAHEDINLITLLCEASESGLEIMRPARAGEAEGWLPVEVSRGQIVVDSADMLSRVTNGVIPATTHRVVNPAPGSNAHRYSLPFFAHPRPSCDLSVIDRFVTSERPCAYPPITAGEFLEQRLHEIGLLPQSDAPQAER
jgi:isopenicillin N synthase-like dioxygenase